LATGARHGPFVSFCVGACKKTHKHSLLRSSSFFFSLGGSVAIHTAISGQIKELSGLIVLDVVEGAYATA
jgi:hypothetical protein